MVVKFGDIKTKARSRWGKEGYERVSAKDIVGKKVIITDVDFVDGRFGETAVVYLKNKTYFLASSEVLKSQLKDIIIPYLEKGEEVEATIGRGKSKSGREYMTFL